MMVNTFMRLGNTIPITVAIPKGLHDQVNRFCEAGERNRSEVVREALRAYLAAMQDSMGAQARSALGPKDPVRKRYSDAELREAVLDFETHADFEMARSDAALWEHATFADGVAELENS
jgi:Arc/MetJ-type ribon-helix-helix transcriptional regulator